MHVHPVPSIPWQVTGNHWLSVPCIHPADGAIHVLGMLHRGARAAVEFAGSENFLDGAGPALLRPVIRLDGEIRELSGEGLVWERAMDWLPTFTCTMGPIVLRGTVFAPFGRDADAPGVVYAIAAENRGDQDVTVTVTLEGVLGHRQIRVRTPRTFDDANCLVQVSEDMLVLEGAALPGVASLAITADGPARVETENSATPRFAMHRELAVPTGQRSSAAFYIAAGPERDGAQAGASTLRRRGWSELLTLTRDGLRELEQTVGHDGLDRLVNRNLLLAYFYSVGRALDDAHFYLVRTRAPWHSRGVTIRDWEALAWILPAVQLADSALARELLMRCCELHGYAPGNGVHYLDGTLFEPGFSLEGVAAYAIACDRYVRDTGDDQVVEEPILADTLYLTWEDLRDRRDEHVPLYSTELGPDGEPVPLPFTLHANAVVAQALEILRRTLDEETARDVEDPDAVRAAIRRQFALEKQGKVTFSAAVDLAGKNVSDPASLASALWLPLYDAVERHDSIYRRTVKGLPDAPAELVSRCGQLLGPDGAEMLRWFRRAPLDNGLASEMVDADGAATGNGADAALGGLLAWSIWYVVHAFGLRP